MPIVPLFGDRSAWDASHYPTLHADDMAAGDTHHPPLTIGGNAGMFYLVNEQELVLANQSAGTVFTGPVSGVPAAPTFRTIRLDQALIDVSILNPVGGDLLQYAHNGMQYIWQNQPMSYIVSATMWEPLSDGYLPSPALVFGSTGEVVMIKRTEP